jgi:hypothetical protein
VADLFENFRLRPIQPGDLISADDTIGGYAFYKGGGGWRFAADSNVYSTGFNSIPMGGVLLVQPYKGALLAIQGISANLRQVGEVRGWRGAPCSPDHQFPRDLGRGRDDNCLTVDAEKTQAGASDPVSLHVAITNSAGAGRFYKVELLVNPAVLGVPSASPADWSAAGIKNDATREKFFAALTNWAKTLQDASTRAFDYSKPQDAFLDVAPPSSIWP